MHGRSHGVFDRRVNTGRARRRQDRAITDAVLYELRGKCPAGAAAFSWMVLAESAPATGPFPWPGIAQRQHLSRNRHAPQLGGRLVAHLAVADSPGVAEGTGEAVPAVKWRSSPGFQAQRCSDLVHSLHQAVSGSRTPVQGRREHGGIGAESKEVQQGFADASMGHLGQLTEPSKGGLAAVCPTAGVTYQEDCEHTRAVSAGLLCVCQQK